MSRTISAPAWAASTTWSRPQSADIVSATTLASGTAALILDEWVSDLDEVGSGVDSGDRVVDVAHVEGDLDRAAVAGTAEPLASCSGSVS
ncbi:hypothetical protein FHX82_005174 [Amycolatopsis bartoniae]|uniref:hypothetical protein n=1 Tax=Amycolatopsis bartoniae TaxID=941986 RepID=UPI001606B167|nr:hypothetical protein [Amycolatopsis bartoniae]MBB2938098.1 hypothetical protein [Amycolatopsis bartoniae]